MDTFKKSVSQKLRMAGKDYSREGWYFVTLSANYHHHIFGKVVSCHGRSEPEMAGNELGKLAEQCWKEIPAHFKHVKLGAWQLMPNHFHGVIGLTEANTDSLGTIINMYKGSVTRIWRSMDVSRHGESVWQPNYWDVICFDQEELSTKEAYIRENPIRWLLKSIPRGVIKKSQYRGNIELLKARPMRALRVSRRATEEEIEKIQADVLTSDAVIVSTFFSPGERTLLAHLLERESTRIIWIMPMGMTQQIPRKWSTAMIAGRALWVSAFPPEMTEATRESCTGCNAWAQKLASQTKKEIL